MRSGRPGIARAGGVRIVYEHRGSGPPLVLCHAFGVNRRMWDDPVGAFAATHQVITFDQRGCGESDHPVPEEGAPDPYTIDTFSEDLAAVLDDLGIARARILGESMGGATALRFAIRFPERVETLILVSTMASRLHEKIVARAREVERIVTEDGVAEAVRFYFRGPLLAGVPKGPAWNAQIERCAAAATPQGFLGAYRVAIDRPSMVDGLGAIRSPALILVGEKDALYLEDAELMRSRIPGARMVVMPGVGHAIHAEDPAGFEREVLDFLRPLS